jgi:glyoxylase-like metal-dependent hydrolase (beta-lactamase superfamily II)
MHEDAARLVYRYNDMPGYVERLLRIGRRHGVPSTALEALPAQVGDRPEYMPLIQPPDHTVADGDTIELGSGRYLEVVHTPGHESAHICLRDSRSGVVFSGDHVLPRISPVIMYDEGMEDPLGSYLRSLRKLHGLHIRTTYPAHGTVMERGDERIRQLLLHHDRRLVDMADLVRESEATAWIVMLRSFRPNLTPLESRLAFLETVSHLEHLRLGGRIRHEDRDGVFVYTR